MPTRDGVAFPRLCQVVGLPAPVAEYRVTASRRFRFDWAWPWHQVALEVEGGLMTGGRHVRPAGLRSDMEKYNLAQVLGWTVLRCTPDRLTHADTLALIRQALQARAPKEQAQ